MERQATRQAKINSALIHYALQDRCYLVIPLIEVELLSDQYAACLSEFDMHHWYHLAAFLVAIASIATNL